MARTLQLVPVVSGRRERGFTLIEMMIVVIIVGVLAALAVAGYRKLIAASHISEAQNMVHSIRVAQEAYHSETQQYANMSTSIPAGNAGWYPATTPGKFVTAWGAACTVCTAGMDWTMLPLHVDGPVEFGYATVAGAASTNPTPASVTVNGAAVTFPSPSPTDWFIVAAAGDTDGNGTFCHVYGGSWTNQVFVDHEGE